MSKNALPGTAQAVITIDSSAAVTRCSFMVWLEHQGGGFIEFFSNYREPTTTTTYTGYNALSLAQGATTSHLGEFIFVAEGKPNTARIKDLDKATGRWIPINAELTKAESHASLDGSVTAKPLQLKPAEGPARTVLLFGANYASEANDTWEFFIDDIRCTL
jgi:hypothetical protein